MAAMVDRIVAAFCIVDDLLQAMGHKDDPQTKVPSSVILTLALAQNLRLFSRLPSKSRFNRRLHALKGHLPLLLYPLSRLWNTLGQAQHYALDAFPLPIYENIRAQRSRLAPGKAYRGYIPSRRVYFHGLKLHLLVDDRLFIHELELTPGSLADVRGLLLLPLGVGGGGDSAQAHSQAGLQAVCALVSVPGHRGAEVCGDSGEHAPHALSPADSRGDP